MKVEGFAMKRLAAVLLVLFMVFPVWAGAEEGPIDVVSGVYSRILKVIRQDAEGRKLCKLRDKQEYRVKDFTPELHQAILRSGQIFEEWHAGKRKHFWENEFLTGMASNNLVEWPTYRIQTQSESRTVVVVQCVGRGFVKQSVSEDNNPSYRRSGAWEVELIRMNNSWRFANVTFSYHRYLLTEFKEFVETGDYRH